MGSSPRHAARRKRRPRQCARRSWGLFLCLLCLFAAVRTAEAKSGIAHAKACPIRTAAQRPKETEHLRSCTDCTDGGKEANETQIITPLLHHSSFPPLLHHFALPVVGFASWRVQAVPKVRCHPAPGLEAVFAKPAPVRTKMRMSLHRRMLRIECPWSSPTQSNPVKVGPVVFLTSCNPFHDTNLKNTNGKPDKDSKGHEREF